MDSHNLSNEDDPICGFPNNEFTGLRFTYIIISSVIAMVGTISNLLLTYVFTFNIEEPNLAVLAFLDVLLCFCYIGLFGTEAVAYYLEIEIVYDALFSFIAIGYTISKIVQLCIPAMLVLSLFQRWCWMSGKVERWWSFLTTRNSRTILSLLIVIGGSICRITSYWVIQIHTYQNCSDHFTSKETWPSPLQFTKWYRNYDLVLTCVQVFGFFVFLLLLNGAIIVHLRTIKRRRQTTLKELNRRIVVMDEEGQLERLVSAISTTIEQDVEYVSATENSAIYTMAIIVTTYLLCNSVHVILTILEKFVPSLIQNEDGSWTTGYIASTDFVSIIFMICSAIRLPIYWKFNLTVRKQLKKLFYCIQTTEETNVELFMKKSMRKPKREYQTIRNVPQHRKSAIALA